MSPPGGNDSAWCIEVRVAEIWHCRPYCDYGGDGRRVCFEHIFVSEFTRAASPMRPKKVILLKIMIIVTNFNIGAGYGAPKRLWNGAGRRHRATRAILSHFPLNLCVFLWVVPSTCTWKALRPFFGTGSWVDGLSGNRTLKGKTNGKFVNLGVQNSEWHTYVKNRLPVDNALVLVPWFRNPRGPKWSINFFLPPIRPWQQSAIFPW
jgi:hypothetical protein